MSDNAANNDTMMVKLAALLAVKGIDFNPVHACGRCLPHTVHLAAIKVCNLLILAEWRYAYCLLNNSFSKGLVPLLLKISGRVVLHTKMMLSYHSHHLMNLVGMMTPNLKKLQKRKGKNLQLSKRYAELLALVTIMLKAKSCEGLFGLYDWVLNTANYGLRRSIHYDGMLRRFPRSSSLMSGPGGPLPIKCVVCIITVLHPPLLTSCRTGSSVPGCY